MNGAADLYGRAILEQAPRVLSLMDRETLSPTAGCCDRTYWAWKFVDFPGARFQEAACVMSFLYATELPASPYFRNPQLLQWIGKGLDFWSSIQYDDGSFDEAYPYERSLAATAFTSFYVSEALHFLGADLAEETCARTLRTLTRAGDWLLRNDETHGFLSNHLAAAAAALCHISRLTQEERFRERSQYFLDKILARQSAEGWYDEYGGADPGYQTHGSFYLARQCQMTSDQRLAESLARSMEFLALLVHADGSLGGEYASRNTQTYYPAAFEMFAPHSAAAAWIAQTMRPSVQTAAAAGLRSVDVYNYFPCLNNLVFAYLASIDRENRPAAPVEPERDQELIWLKEAGIARVRRTRYDAYVGVAKGGVLKVFDRACRKHVYTDCGYIGKLRGGKLFSNQIHRSPRGAAVGAAEISVEGAFFEVAKPVMRPSRFVAFRLFTLTAGRFPALARWLKNRLVRALIYNQQALDIRFQRHIEFQEDRIVIRDLLAGSDGARALSLERGGIFTTIHMGSSRYFIPGELENRASIEPPRDPAILPEQLRRGVQLERTVRFG